MCRLHLRGAALCLAVLACLAAAIRPAWGTIVAPLDLVQLVQHASLVVVGRVVDVTAVRVEGRFTDSLVSLDPAEVLKGHADGTVVFRVAGGEIGRYRTIVVGAPVLRAGDEVVVFLAGDAPQVPHVVGFSQGVLPIMRDDLGRALLLVPAIAERAGASRTASGSGRARLTTVSAFADDVRAIAEGRTAAKGGRTPTSPKTTSPGGAGQP
jgi:hypothetical protein